MFVSDHDKGLDKSRAETFQKNHTTYYAHHIKQSQITFE